MEKRENYYVLMGDPIAWSRAGVVVRGGHAIFYDSQKELKLKVLVDLERQHEGPKFTLPLGMNVDFFLSIPATRRVKNRPTEEFPWNIQKIDTDNFLKFLLDTLVKSGAILTDDCIIAEIHARKLYDYMSKGPRTEFTLKEL